jgi:Kef-type K+ transport system membrane component KefB
MAELGLAFLFFVIGTAWEINDLYFARRKKSRNDP